MEHQALLESLDRILVPTDFSDNAKEAVRCAADLARASGATLLIVHAIQPTIYPMYRVIKHGNFPNMEEEVAKFCQRSLEDLVAEIGEGLECETEVIEGTPARAIVELADSKDAGLIVIATHGHTGLKHALLGSTAEKVVRTARCPVLTFRARDTGAAPASSSQG